jgi:hypothetical protein
MRFCRLLLRATRVVPRRALGVTKRLAPLAPMFLRNVDRAHPRCHLAAIRLAFLHPLSLTPRLRIKGRTAIRFAGVMTLVSLRLLPRLSSRLDG